MTRFKRRMFFGTILIVLVVMVLAAWFYVPKKGSESYFSISFSERGQSFLFSPFKLDNYLQRYGEWQYRVFELPMPNFTTKQEQDTASQVEFYFFNNSGMDCYIDDLKIEFIAFKQMDRVLDVFWERDN